MKPQTIVFLMAVLAAAIVCPIADALAQDSETAGSEQERRQLLGDWGGARSTLADHGIIVDVQATQFYQGVTDGASDDNWKYGLKGDYFVTLIGEKLGLWKGLSATIHAETRAGDDVSALTGISPANSAMTYPVAGEDLTAITQLLVNQQLGNELMLSAGKFNAFDLFDLAFHSGRGIDKFMNTSLVIPLSLARTIPAAFMGAALLKLKGQEVQGAVAVYDPNNSATTSGFDPLFGDTGLVGVWKFIHESGNGGRPGYVSVGANWSGKEYALVEPSSLAFNPGEGLTLTNTDTSWSIFSIVDHQLWGDHSDPTRDLRFIGQFVLADGGANFMEWTVSGALEMNGPLPRRGKDTLGVGVFYVGLSDDFKNTAGPLLSLAATARNQAPTMISLQETRGLEVYYKAQITPWFALTGDVQVIEPSISVEDTKLVVGLRGKTTF